MNTNIENTPANMRDEPHWDCWRHEPRYPGEEPTKIPYDPRNGCRAKSNDPRTWTSFATARAAIANSRGRYSGLGFMLTDPFIGVDLDDCRDDAGTIHARALQIIQSMSTYTEVSPSGRGVKMIGTGKMPTPDGGGKNYRKDPWGTGVGGIEFYQRGRMFCITGSHLERTPTETGTITGPLAHLYRELYPPAPARKQTNHSTAGGVDEAARIVRCARYMDRLPASVSGQGGHARLLHAACVTIRFGLDDGSALDLLHHYNRRAVPPWDDREIERKLSEARNLAGSERGSMLAGNNTHCKAQARRRVI